MGGNIKTVFRKLRRSVLKQKRISILWWSKDERAGKTKEGLGMQELRKPDPYHPSLPHVVTINGFQVLLNSVTCLSSYPIWRRYLSYSSLHPVYVLHPISKWPIRPLSHSSCLGYKSGLRTPVQGRFSLELACCSNSVSYSDKLHFPLILSHIWKFFSILRPDHESYGCCCLGFVTGNGCGDLLGVRTVVSWCLCW